MILTSVVLLIVQTLFKEWELEEAR